MKKAVFVGVSLVALSLAGYVLSLAVWLANQNSGEALFAAFALVVVGGMAMWAGARAAIVRLLLMALLAMSISGCARVGPGYVGIKVSMAGDSKGVDSVPAVTGWTFYNPFLSSVYEYPTFVQTAVWTANTAEGKPVNEEITFTNADQMQIAADISLAYHLDPAKVPTFYVKFRSDDLNTFTHGFLRNIARDQFDKHGGKYKIEQIMGDNAGFLADVRSALQVELSPIGVELDQFGFIGAPRPPAAVIEAINAKVHATQLAQQKQNEIVQAQADAAKTVAQTEGYAKSVLIRAEAEAEGNRKVAASLTRELIELRALEKWNGTLPTMTGGAIPFVNVSQPR